MKAPINEDPAAYINPNNHNGGHRIKKVKTKYNEKFVFEKEPTPDRIATRKLAPGITIELEKIKRCKEFKIVEFVDPFATMLYIYGVPKDDKEQKMVMIAGQLYGYRTAQEVLQACVNIAKELEK